MTGACRTRAMTGKPLRRFTIASSLWGISTPAHSKVKRTGFKSNGGGRNFVNPPYSQLKKWVLKSIEEAKKGKEVVLLIPSRTDTKAFKALFDYGCDFVFIHKRLRFNDSNCAPFPSMLVVLNGTENTIDLTDENGILERF